MDLSVSERYVLATLRDAGGILSAAERARIPTSLIGGVPSLVRKRLAGFDDAGDRLGLTPAGEVIAEEAL